SPIRAHSVRYLTAITGILAVRCGWLICPCAIESTIEGSSGRRYAMPEMPDEADVLERVVRWAEDQPLIRAVILESSRAVAQAPLDHFSDYDILLVVSDARPFAESNDWQRFFGEPLVRFGDSVDVLGIETHMRLVVYRDHTKIDFALW